MATAMSCSSRFSVLKLEDDEPEVKDCNTSTRTASKLKEVVPVNKKKPKKKKNFEETKADSDLQNLAFGISKNKKKPGAIPGRQGKNKVSDQQWEEWMKKDKAFVTDAYEQDMQEAIMLSKLEYEEKKEFYEAMKPEDQGKSVRNNKKANKKKEKSTLSLDQFNSLPSSEIDNFTKENNKTVSPVKCKSETVHSVTDEKFFVQLEEDTEKLLQKEHRIETYKKQQTPRALQFQDELEKRDKEIERLKQDIDKLKGELLTVKTRNKKLCNILAQAEMRDKAEILISVEQLTRIKDELTEQVTELHTSLEQERSKVHSLQMELKKFQGGRKESK